MKRFREAVLLRSLMWKLGRRMYTYARGEGQNNPRTNGEYWLLERVVEAAAGPEVYLDIGANKGDWTGHALGRERNDSGLHIHAFEPSPSTRLALAARFQEMAQVSVHPFAVADVEGTATFYGDGAGVGTNSLSPTSGKSEGVVKVTTVDRFLQRHGIGSVAMVKIDTEGFDLLVLRGAEQSLRKGQIGVLQFEYNWRWLLNHACLRDVFDLIADKPYRLGKLVGHSIEFYDQWHFELDRFFENNYVLVSSGGALKLGGLSFQFDESNVSVQS